MSNYAVICLDESSSMLGQNGRVASSLNEYVDALPEDTHISVFLFNSSKWDTFYDGPKNTWKDMKDSDYDPGAMTPLFDAIGKTILHAGTISTAGDKVLVMIDTDGQENYSKEHTFKSVEAQVAQKQAEGWEFLYMANGLTERDAHAVGNTGGAMGMTVNAASYATRDANFLRAATNTNNYFSGATSVAPVQDLSTSQTPAPPRPDPVPAGRRDSKPFYP